MTDKKENKDEKPFFELPPLPWARNALVPHITEETINYHYGKHHQAYVNNLNDLCKTNESLKTDLTKLVQTLDSGKPFNQAAQIWNHTFYWNSLSPKGGGTPKNAKLSKMIDESFGSFQKFKDAFTAEAAGHFGSGWAWLVYSEGKLSVCGTHDAGNPMSKNAAVKGVPILTCDVWEHAYYIDFKNARGDYIKAWWNLVNWDFAEANLESATKTK